MRPFFYILIALLFSLTLNAQTYELDPLPFTFEFPVDIATANDGRLFIVEQRGRIMVINTDGTKQESAFLNIINQVNFGGERGLLGIALHPNFLENGLFYVNYTNIQGTTIISSFRLEAGATSVSSNTENELLRIAQPFGNHNGGCLKFGPDGYLYIGLGDGGSGGDPQNFSQNNGELLGKMLRIAVDEIGGHSIPADNPFIADAGIPDEIWATGLRNPWRFSFDRATGDLWIADVGQNAFEEINKVEAGEGKGLDFGWRCWEGTEVFNPSGCAADNTFFFPIYTYPNTASIGRSVTGGFVYRGMDIPDLQGTYIYGDFASRIIWSLEELSTGELVNTELLRGGSVSSFGETLEGELLVTSYSGNGTISQLKQVSVSTNDEKNLLTSLEITPNPFQNELVVQLKSKPLTVLQVQLLNLKGQVLREAIIESSDVNGVFDTRDLVAGVYILSIATDTVSISKKLVKL